MQEWIQRGIFSPLLSLPWKVEESDRKQCPRPEPGMAEYKPVCRVPHKVIPGVLAHELPPLSSHCYLKPLQITWETSKENTSRKENEVVKQKIKESQSPGRAHIDTHTCAYMNTHVHAHTNTDACICTHMHVYAYTWMYEFLHTRVRTHTVPLFYTLIYTVSHINIIKFCSCRMVRVQPRRTSS